MPTLSSRLAVRFRPAAAAVAALLVALVLPAVSLPLAAAPDRAAAAQASESRPASLDDARLVGAIDALFSKAYPADEPGAAVIVVRDGEVLLRKGYGMAHLELGVPVEPDMVFRLGSITKQFTAVAVLMLVEEGKISLDAPMTAYLPDYPDGGDEITVHHLLTHLSGIPSYTGMEGWMERVRDDLSVDEMIALFKDESLEFEPGERFAYNNSAYFLLGAILEKVSGMSYADFIRQRIFEPLGMESSYYGDPARVIPRRAAGYAQGSDGYRNAPYLSMTQPYAAGSLLSTVDDLARWDAALYTDRLLGEASREKLWTPARLNDGRSVHYGYGWQLWEYEGHPIVEHGGGIFGFVTAGLRLPQERVFIAALSNNTAKPVRQTAFEAATLILGKPLAERPRLERPASELAEYVGVYEVEGDPEDTRVLRLEDGALTSQRTGGSKSAVFFLGEDEIGWEDSTTRARFERDAGGRVVAMTVHRGFGPDERAALTDRPLPSARQAVEIDPQLLGRYVGRYELAPGFVMAITREGDRLFGQATGQPKIELFAESETRFFPEVVDATIEFREIEGDRAGLMVLFQAGRELPGRRLEED